MENLDAKLQALDKVLVNLKKAPHRAYKRETLINKKIETKELLEQINDILLWLENIVEEQIFYDKNRQAKLLSGQIYYLIDEKLANLDFEKIPRIKTIFLVILAIAKFKKFKMANLNETIKTVSALMPQYDGTADKLTSVLDALEIVKTLQTDANKQTIVGVVLTKLDTKVRHSFGQKPENVDAIIEVLKQTVTKIPPETIIAKLATCKQKESLTDFIKEIEMLSIQLENAYITKQIPPGVAKDLAAKEAIKNMANGLKVEQTKLVLLAGNFTQLSDATNKVLEVNPTLEQNAKILQLRAQESRNQNKTERARNERDTRDSYRAQGQGRNINNAPRSRFNNETAQGGPTRYNQQRFGQPGSNQPRFPNENFYRQRNFYPNPYNGGYNGAVGQQFNGPRPRYNQQMYQQGQVYQQTQQRPNNVYVSENQTDGPAAGQAACVSQTNTAPSQINQAQLQQLAQHLMQQQRQT